VESDAAVFMKHLFVALVLVTAGMIAGIVTVGAGVPIVPTEVLSWNTVVFQLDWLQNLIEQIDQFLEAVVDLVKTLKQLFSGEGG
jgi:hypothetical protein